MKDVTRKEVLTKAYEDLRDYMVYHKMTPASPRGLALFLNRGMPGWIEDWSRMMTSDKAIIARRQTEVTGERYAGSLPAAATVILTNMALAAIRREIP
jgi:hypothetical protein